MRVAFDIGNVLVAFDIDIFVKRLHKELNISEREALYFLEHLQHHQDIGVTTVAQSLRTHYKLDDVDHLVKAWNDILVPNERMLRFLENLRDEGVKVALLSNMGKEHAVHLRTTCPELFKDAYQHLSFEVGARKPTKLFFQSFCLEHNEFLGCLYLDDLEENLQMGKKFCFSAYRFQLDKFLKESQSKQKLELDKIKKHIFSKI